MLNLNDGQKAICIISGADELVAHWNYFRSVLFHKQ
jgi:hypothetical protein